MDSKELIKEIIDLQRTADRMRRQYELEVWMELPLTIAQLKSLFFISNCGTTNLGKLAEALKVTSTNTTGIVDRLVKQGMISRSEDPRDRRMLELKATEKGEKLINSLRQRRRGFMFDVLSRLSEAELEDFLRANQIFARAAETIDKEKK